MATELPEPVDLSRNPLDLLRQRVALWNRRLHDLAADLGRIDLPLAEAIGNHTQQDYPDTDSRTEAQKRREKP